MVVGWCGMVVGWCGMVVGWCMVVGCCISSDGLGSETDSKWKLDQERRLPY